jgi:hypothetical protein
MPGRRKYLERQNLEILHPGKARKPESLENLEVHRHGKLGKPGKLGKLARWKTVSPGKQSSATSCCQFWVSTGPLLNRRIKQ